MRTVLQRIEHALTFCKEYADGSWSIATEKFRHHVTPDLLEDTRQELESLQLKLMHAETKLAKYEKREPVAWLDPWTGTNATTDYDAYGRHGIPLYTKGTTNV